MLVSQNSLMVMMMNGGESALHQVPLPRLQGNLMKYGTLQFLTNEIHFECKRNMPTQLQFNLEKGSEQKNT